LRPLGTVRDPLMIAKRVPWATIPATLDAILMDQSATGRIDPLLIAETAKEMLGNLDFGEPQFTGTSDRMSFASVRAERIHDLVRNGRIKRGKN
jgi:hypothetical protein